MSKFNSSSHWNYRIAKQSWPALQINPKLKRPSGHEFVIVEAYYNSKKKCDGWTRNEMSPYGETIEELITCLERMLKDARKCKASKPLRIEWKPCTCGAKQRRPQWKK